MKYLLLVCRDPSVQLDPEDGAAAGRAVGAWVRELQERGMHVDGDQLAPPDDARTIRVRRDEVVVADGPFAETKEHIAGFDILECADLDEAVEVASRHPVARFGTIEVRPFYVD
jgi:hypothetical protein